MRIGILADIHEDVETLRRALDRLRGEGVGPVVVLGDVFYAGRRMGETAALLLDAGAVGVWGNHDLGVCLEPDEEMCRRWAGPALDLAARLRPRFEVGGCLFSHGLPHWDATDPMAYYCDEQPEEPEATVNSFAAVPHGVVFVGHFHRWVAATAAGRLPWDGEGPICLHPEERWMVVIAAVCDGWCAVFDTDSRVLQPHRLRA
jgi:predicted phosphodiesterase